MKSLANSSLQKIRRMLIVNVGLIAVFSICTVLLANLALQDGIRLKVYALGKQFSHHQSFKLANHNEFVSGRDGELLWYPANIGQALLLGTIDGSGMDVFHVGLLGVLVLVFYLMTRGTSRQLVFSKKIYHGFLFIVLYISLLGTLETFKSIGMGIYVQHITNGQFRLLMPYIPANFYYAFGSLLFFILQFAQMGIRLQEEQSLTI